MDSCEVLIAGGGPAGSPCAWELRRSDLGTMILDKQIFPRDKIRGGWITRAVLDALEIDRHEYASSRTYRARIEEQYCNEQDKRSTPCTA
jgi:flavin-dependent dehydrogenase